MLVLHWIACVGDNEVRYEVQAGDTLFLVAKRHGVTVEDLRSWNSIEGDLIEIGQILVIRSPAPPAAPVAPPRASRPAAPGALRMPPAQACLPPPQGGEGDHEFAASQGLDRGQVATSLGAFAPALTACVDGEPPTGTLTLEIVVACTGRVDRVAVVTDPGWPGPVVACVVDRLRFAPFPAHDLPDGEEVLWPLSFAAG